MIVIGLSSGHGGPRHSSSCASGGRCAAACGTKAGIDYGIIEAEYTVGLRLWLTEALNGQSFMSETDQQLVALNQPVETVGVGTRGKRARANNCDLVLALHVNEGHPQSHGAHMLHRPGDGFAAAVALPIAQQWPNALQRDITGRWRGDTYLAGMVEPATRELWPKAHGLLAAYAPVPTVLVETFYASNATDCLRALDASNQVEMVAALMAGVATARRIKSRS